MKYGQFVIAQKTFKRVGRKGGMVMNDRKFDDLLELHEENIGKKITISINKKIYKKVISLPE